MSLSLLLLVVSSSHNYNVTNKQHAAWLYNAYMLGGQSIFNLQSTEENQQPNKIEVKVIFAVMN